LLPPISKVYLGKKTHHTQTASKDQEIRHRNRHPYVGKRREMADFEIFHAIEPLLKKCFE